ncbi:carbohydrate sulfotransferase 4-like isoform X2 [Homarus americanus]|uniref:carbohydrate sulfotransferase 4-like isoform X2 n=1 Tax=Homarus americanus TaxID=6706 RepID=UPI001C493ACF|nr:carbohydrate sulfotransferase 4-like isoform X2 [Homarus americanus]
MDFHSLRRQKGRVLLMALTGTSLLLFILNQSNLTIPVRPGSEHPPPSSAIYENQDTTLRSTTLRDEAQRDAANLVFSHLQASPSRQDPEKETGEKEEVGKRDDTWHKVDMQHGEEARPREADVLGEKLSENEVSEEEVDQHKAEEVDQHKAEEVDQYEEEEVIKESNPNVAKKNEPSPDTGREEIAGIREGASGKKIFPATREGKIQAILSKQREQLAKSMIDYKFHPEIKAKSMDDLVMEKGGNPVRSLVITTWRSGSTFIGEVLQTHPATYYHYEPLLDFGITQVRYGKVAELAVHNLRNLLTCNYTDMENYLNYGPEHPYLFMHNKPLWNYCASFPNLCWKPDFLTPFCRLFPFQSLKTVRLRLNLTKEFLEDKTLGVQVLLLVRDPRGTLQSRHHRKWCPGYPDCDNPARLCNDMISDYNTAHVFRRRFPHSFRVIRYEDLSFQAYNMTKELFNFFHLNYHPNVQKFLDTHTKQKYGGVSSTFRDSKTAPVHWQQDLSWEEVEIIQKVCLKALTVWGYEIAKNETHLRSFMPVGKLKNGLY